MNRIEFLANLDKYKGEDHSTFLQHYGILGQKWGQRRWQNADGTFNEAGKERYFGTKSKSSSSEEDKVGSAKSEAKDYLKFRNKMLKERTRPDLNQWYRDQHKNDDKQLVKNAKKVDKSREKMYRDQLKDFYDDPNELVADLKNVYKISGQPGKNNSNIPKKVYEANKNDPQALKILEDYYKNHRDEENKDPETEAMDKFYNEKEEQKVGSWSLSKNNKPYYKELKSTVKELGLDKDKWDLDKKNGVLTKEFKENNDSKHNIGLFATTDKENMKNLTDKINKTYSKENIDKIFDNIREQATEKAYKKYVKDYKDWGLDDEILSRDDFKKSIIIPKSIIFNDKGKSDMLYFEVPYKPGTDWFIESYWTGDLDADGNLSKLKFEWN